MTQIETHPGLSVDPFAEVGKPLELIPPIVNAWGSTEHMVGDEAFLPLLHSEALIARDAAKARGEDITGNEESRGLEIVRLRTKEFEQYPGVDSWLKRAEQELGLRYFLAQFNFYQPGGAIFAHRDSGGFQGDTTICMGISGEGDFRILADPDLGFHDARRVKMHPGSGVVLAPIRAGGFTTRTHAAENTGNEERVVLLAAFS